tara:strand:+ start:1312 stop:1515 length:204 start_codon:yes stop_codon:yes gene_type:complete
MKETVKRSLAKTISWRITASLTTFIIAWILTGDYIIGSSIALIEAVVKIFLYYFHERSWNLISWGNK